MTCKEWLTTWIEIYAPVRCTSAVTIQRYKCLANYLIQGATPELYDVANTELSELTHLQVEPAMLSLLRAPAHRREHLSRRTLRHVAGMLHACFSKACKLGIVRQNCMQFVELPPAEKSQARSLSVEEIERLRRACRHDWTGPFVELALATACRRGELLALEWSDLNPHTRRLTISKALEETAEFGIRLKCTKNGKARACTLPHSAMFLFPHLTAGEPRRGLLFPDPAGRWMSPALVSQTIIRRMRKAGIEHASLHSLRHTHASTLLSHGMPLPAVSARLGHSDPAFTLRVYAHALPLDDHRLADDWDKVISEMR